MGASPNWIKFVLLPMPIESPCHGRAPYTHHPKRANCHQRRVYLRKEQLRLWLQQPGTQYFRFLRCHSREEFGYYYTRYIFWDLQTCVFTDRNFLFSSPLRIVRRHRNWQRSNQILSYAPTLRYTHNSPLLRIVSLTPFVWSNSMIAVYHWIIRTTYISSHGGWHHTLLEVLVGFLYFYF